MRDKRTAFLILLCLIGFPVCARADAGTALMWGTFLHLVFGNIFLGVFEGFLIGKFFSIRIWRAMVIMIFANYFSAWIGYFFIRAVDNRLPMDVNSFWRWFWLMVFVTYCMTLVLEWPFVAFCFRGSGNWLSKSIRASFVAQTASYIVLLGYYELASSPGVVAHDVRVVPSASLSLPEGLSVYFISSEDGNVYRRPIIGGVSEKIRELHSTNEGEYLFFQTNSLRTNHWDLLVNLTPFNYTNPTNVNVAKDIPAAIVPIRNDEFENPIDATAQSLGTVTNAHWIVSTPSYSGALHCYNPALQGNHRFRWVYYETPVCWWPARNAYYISSDLVLFQLGSDQICVFSPEQYKLALLWHGRGAIPVMERKWSDK